MWMKSLATSYVCPYIHCKKKIAMKSNPLDHSYILGFFLKMIDIYCKSTLINIEIKDQELDKYLKVITCVQLNKLLIICHLFKELVYKYRVVF